MLEIYSEPIDVAATAAEAMAGTNSVTTSAVEELQNTSSKCHIVHHYRQGDTSQPAIVVRTYGGIGHTFVMDGQHRTIKPGDQLYPTSISVVKHACDSVIAWCHGFRLGLPALPNQATVDTHRAQAGYSTCTREDAPFVCPKP